MVLSLCTCWDRVSLASFSDLAHPARWLVGTSVGVFGSLWPGETGARSTYAVDNGKPTEFVPPGLQGPSRLQFYASGALPEGEHTLKVTNLGSFLWLDYFEYDDVVPSGTAGSGATTTFSPKTTTTQTTTTTARPSPVTITTTASPSHDVAGPLSSTTSQPSASASSQASAPRTSPTASPSSSSSATAAPPPLSPVPSSPSSTSLSSAASSASSPNSPPPPQDAATPKTHAHPLSRGARVGLIAATTVGGVALLALVLLCFVRRRRARSRLRLGDAAIPSKSPMLLPSP